jgi:hypothetical protein
MKKVKNKNHSNRLLYTFITLGILILVAGGIYAATSYAASGAGHNLNELAQPCSNGQILKVSGGVWACGTDVSSSVTRGSTAIYMRSNGCNTPTNADLTNMLTAASTCTTRSCATSRYYDCSGAYCVSSSPQSCSNAFLGYLVT